MLKYKKTKVAMKSLQLIALFIVPTHIYCMEIKKAKHKEFITYIATKVKYQPQPKPFIFEFKETISVKIETSAKKEDIENVIIQNMWTNKDIETLDGHYLICWKPEDKPAKLNMVGYSNLHCQSNDGKPISSSSSLQKSASAKF